MQTMTLDDFQAACMERFPSSLQTAVKCPMCGTIQTAQDFIDAGQGHSFDDVQGKLGYSCIGRYTGAGSPRKNPDGKPCNWTLGGLFRFHKLEVVTPDGKSHPHFELATKAEAEAHRATKAAAKEGAQHAN